MSSMEMLLALMQDSFEGNNVTLTAKDAKPILSSNIINVLGSPKQNNTGDALIIEKLREIFRGKIHKEELDALDPSHLQTLRPLLTNVMEKKDGSEPLVAAALRSVIGKEAPQELTDHLIWITIPKTIREKQPERLNGIKDLNADGRSVALSDYAYAQGTIKESFLRDTKPFVDLPFKDAAYSQYVAHSSIDDAEVLLSEETIRRCMLMAIAGAKTPVSYKPAECPGKLAETIATTLQDYGGHPIGFLSTYIETIPSRELVELLFKGITSSKNVTQISFGPTQVNFYLGPVKDLPGNVPDQVAKYLAEVIGCQIQDPVDPAPFSPYLFSYVREMNSRCLGKAAVRLREKYIAVFGGSPSAERLQALDETEVAEISSLLEKDETVLKADQLLNKINFRQDDSVESLFSAFMEHISNFKVEYDCLKRSLNQGSADRTALRDSFMEILRDNYSKGEIKVAKRILDPEILRKIVFCKLPAKMRSIEEIRNGLERLNDNVLEAAAQYNNFVDETVFMAFKFKEPMRTALREHLLGFIARQPTEVLDHLLSSKENMRLVVVLSFLTLREDRPLSPEEVSNCPKCLSDYLEEYFDQKIEGLDEEENVLGMGTEVFKKTLIHFIPPETVLHILYGAIEKLKGPLPSKDSLLDEVISNSIHLTQLYLDRWKEVLEKYSKDLGYALEGLDPKDWKDIFYGDLTMNSLGLAFTKRYLALSIKEYLSKNNFSCISIDELMAHPSLTRWYSDIVRLEPPLKIVLEMRRDANMKIVS